MGRNGSALGPGRPTATWLTSVARSNVPPFSPLDDRVTALLEEDRVSALLHSIGSARSSLLDRRFRGGRSCALVDELGEHSAKERFR